MVCGSRSRPNALLRLSRSYSRFSPLINSPRWQRLSQGALFELRTVNSPKMSAFSPDSDARALVSNRLVLPLSSHPARRRAGLGQWNLVIRSLVGEGGLGAGQRERLRRSLLAQLVWQYRGVYLPGQDHSMFAVRCHATG